MAYFKRRKKSARKILSLNDEVTAAFQEQERRFREKFGVDPGPEDPIFFDPNADTPQPISQAGLDEMMGQLLSAAGKAGIRPELIYAMKTTGRMVTESNQHLLTNEELQEWRDATEEYRALVEKQEGREQSECIHHGSEDAQRSFDSTCRKPHRFLSPPQR